MENSTQCMQYASRCRSIYIPFDINRAASSRHSLKLWRLPARRYWDMFGISGDGGTTSLVYEMEFFDGTFWLKIAQHSVGRHSKAQNVEKPHFLCVTIPVAYYGPPHHTKRADPIEQSKCSETALKRHEVGNFSLFLFLRATAVVGNRLRDKKRLASDAYTDECEHVPPFARTTNHKRNKKLDLARRLSRIRSILDDGENSNASQNRRS